MAPAALKASEVLSLADGTLQSGRNDGNFGFQRLPALSFHAK